MFSVQVATNCVAHAPKTLSATEHFHHFLLNLCWTEPDTVFLCLKWSADRYMCLFPRYLLWDSWLNDSNSAVTTICWWIETLAERLNIVFYFTSSDEQKNNDSLYINQPGLII